MQHRARRSLAIATALVVAGAVLVAPAQGASRKDTDHDGMPDRWERAHGLDWRKANARADADHDGVSNIREFKLGTDPRHGHPLCDALGSVLGDAAEECGTMTLPLLLT